MREMENKTLAPHHSGTRPLIFRRVREIAKSDDQFRHVCLSVGMEQLGSYWTDFHEILCLSILRKICLENSRVIKIWKE